MFDRDPACRSGSGPLSAALRDRGAVVTGIDASAGMLALARQRLGDDADLHVADLSDRLPFADGTFDDVVASLVLHYLEDWGPTLAEMRRVLRPGGRLIASVQHPFVDYVIQDPRPNYFATTSYAEEWTFNGRSFPMIFWRRPYAAGPAPLAPDTNDLRRLAAVQFGPFLQPRRDCGVVDPWRAGTARQEAAVRGWMGRWTIS